MSEWQDLCYLIHKRPFKDNYTWVYLLTKSHGITTACMRESKRQRLGCEPLLTFGRYWCKGRLGQILKLNKIELETKAADLKGVSALSGLYMNELLYATSLGLELETIFDAYGVLLNGLLGKGSAVLIALREFELLLLDELGYSLPFDNVRGNSYNYYHYNNQMGLVGSMCATNFTFTREHLIAIQSRNWLVPGVLPAARQLTKQVFTGILDGKVLKSHSWFVEQV